MCQCSQPDSPRTPLTPTAVPLSAVDALERYCTAYLGTPGPLFGVALRLGLFPQAMDHLKSLHPIPALDPIPIF